MKSTRIIAVSAGVLLAATFVYAATTARYLHVKVTNPTTHELVRVNVPLMLAERVIPAINHGELRNGKIHIGKFEANNVNIREILDALKTAPEGEFVTVQNTGNDVHVAKEHGQMVVHVFDKGDKQNVDVTVPWEVAQALISDTTENQLNGDCGRYDLGEGDGERRERSCLGRLAKQRRVKVYGGTGVSPVAR